MITDGSPTYFFQHTVGQSVVFQSDGLPTPVGSGVEWQPTCNKKPWRSGIPKPADGDAIGESKWISMFMSKNLITQLLHQITGDFLMNNQPILGRGPKRTQNEPADPSCLTPQHHVSKSQEVRRPLHQTPWKGGTSGKYDGDFIRFVRPNHFFVGSYRTYVPCISQVPKNDDKYIYINIHPLAPDVETHSSFFVSNCMSPAFPSWPWLIHPASGWIHLPMFHWYRNMDLLEYTIHDTYII